MLNIEKDENGLVWHCRVAALLLRELPSNPHTNHHIRSAIREASVAIRGKHQKFPKNVDFYSTAARDQLTYGDASGLVREHVVPVSIISKKIFELNNPIEINIINIVHEWTILALITHKEHELLRENGLYDKMPKNWCGVDKFSRYKELAIELFPTPT
ncbi:hypothetical protein OIN59_18560 [Acidovorax sp. D2M1]|uniref:Uncharacterized protein n=1 Tax=Acidovorax benzenivorans TaxID=2987520 RepID=A0ABT5S0G3_9BURK|nr:hypothetical protein [Acidovorax benzenivorans]MDD2179444.1 hypothetical protein [Acidovorax benzenivorans]